MRSHSKHGGAIDSKHGGAIDFHRIGQYYIQTKNIKLIQKWDIFTIYGISNVDIMEKQSNASKYLCTIVEILRNCSPMFNICKIREGYIIARRVAAYTQVRVHIIFH